MIYEKKNFQITMLIINLKRVTVRKGCHFYFSNIKMNKIFFFWGDINCILGLLWTEMAGGPQKRACQEALAARRGAKTVSEIIKACPDLGINTLTLYAFFY